MIEKKIKRLFFPIVSKEVNSFSLIILYPSIHLAWSIIGPFLNKRRNNESNSIKTILNTMWGKTLTVSLAMAALLWFLWLKFI